MPIAGELRERVETLITAARKRVADRKAAGQIVPIGALNLIVRDFTGEKWRGRDMTGDPWSQRDFIEKFGIIRAHAAAEARAQGNDDLAERLEALEFRDTRRTCVTRLGNLGMSVPTIAAITGHSIKTVERIIETYLVRTAAQAGRGIVALLGAERARKAPFRNATEASST